MWRNFRCGEILHVEWEGNPARAGLPDPARPAKGRKASEPIQPFSGQDVEAAACKTPQNAFLHRQITSYSAHYASTLYIVQDDWMH